MSDLTAKQQAVLDYLREHGPTRQEDLANALRSTTRGIGVVLSALTWKDDIPLRSSGDGLAEDRLWEVPAAGAKSRPLRTAAERTAIHRASTAASSAAAAALVASGLTGRELEVARQQMIVSLMHHEGDRLRRLVLESGAQEGGEVDRLRAVIVGAAQRISGDRARGRIGDWAEYEALINEADLDEEGVPLAQRQKEGSADADA
jgi:hypothetical protein